VIGKTIIYLPNWLGDMVMATPFLHALRQAGGGQTWAVGKPSAMYLYHGLDLFDRFILYDGKGLVRFFDIVGAMRGARFERGIVLPHSFRSALLFFLAAVSKRVGYDRNGRGFMLSQAVEEGAERPPEPTVAHYLRILDAMGIERSVETPFLKATEDEERRFDERFPDVSGAYAVFIAGAEYGPSKRWPEGHFSALADMLAEKLGLKVYLLPGKGEEEIAGRVCNGARNAGSVHVKLMDVRDMKVCLARASVVVGNDTGPRHVSAALGVPTVVVMGPMDNRYTSYASRFTETLSKDVPCRPCNERRCGRDHECLKGIGPEQVFSKVEEVLAWKSGRN
jgi:heptosyltransferase-2